MAVSRVLSGGTGPSLGPLGQVSGAERPKRAGKLQERGAGGRAPPLSLPSPALVPPTSAWAESPQPRMQNHFFSAFPVSKLWTLPSVSVSFLWPRECLFILGVTLFLAMLFSLLFIQLPPESLSVAKLVVAFSVSSVGPRRSWGGLGRVSERPWKGPGGSWGFPALWAGTMEAHIECSFILFPAPRGSLIPPLVPPIVRLSSLFVCLHPPCGSLRGWESLFWNPAPGFVFMVPSGRAPPVPHWACGSSGRASAALLRVPRDRVGDSCGRLQGLSGRLRRGQAAVNLYGSFNGRGRFHSMTPQK